MNVTVSGLVWFRKDQVGKAIIEKLREDLTLERKAAKDFDDGTPKFVNLFHETDVHFGVPRQYWAAHSVADHNYDWSLVSFGHPVEYGCAIEHTGEYHEQESAVSTFVRMFGMAKRGILEGDTSVAPSHVIRNMGGVLLGKPGFGKSQVALSIMHRLGRTALVVVNKEFLMRQWIKRIEKFLPGARVGIVREDVCDFEGKDIVVAMIHSLALDDMTGSRYPLGLYQWPGIVVVDEVHHVASETWSVLPMRFSSAFRLGLSATPSRKDGTERVFFDHIGPVSFVAKTNMAMAGVRVSKFSGTWPMFMHSGDANSSAVLSRLCKSRPRTLVVVKEVLAALNAPSRRKVMVLSHRLEHLEAIEEMVKASKDCPEDLTAGHYVGEWFSGGDVKVLKKGHWDMNAEGRKKAVAAIYASLTRRKGGQGRIEKRTWIDPWTEEESKGKAHIVTLPEKDTEGEVYDAILGNLLEDIQKVTTASEGDLILEALGDDSLFEIAERFDIRQDRDRKKAAVSEEELEEAERARLLLVTFQMAEEALDIPPVDTVVLASPSGDVAQAVGRGRRFCVPQSEGGKIPLETCEHFCPWKAGACKGKSPLVVVDIVDSMVPVSERRYRWRGAYYRDEGYKVSEQ